ncbi:long-chain-fatty-acid--CoA ligase [Vannielia litorea]|uniref:long-chain-fatty-acid--CoA ligase n=1 Tax=Vannielia litorea TaxID=1217970 RepID=UPI001BD15698|nr:long-chain-fatty-acid--CoA ligase [Vannielia litorea]MBS8224674.1 AMP-dependent synthetase and ligase [Vannielia litorea]
MHQLNNIETLRDVFDRNLALHPDRAAYIYEDVEVSHRMFSDAAFRLANALSGLGVRRQDRVAILAQNGPRYLEAYAACETAAYVLVPINYRLSAPEIDYILKDSQPRVLLYETEYAGIVEELKAGNPGIVSYICIDGEGAEAYQTLLAGASPEPPRTRPAPQDLTYLIYTSGTTGRPKGAMHDHRGQVHFARIMASELGIGPVDRMLLVMPFYHIGAKCSHLGCSYRGAAIVLMRKYDIAAVSEQLERHRATMTHLAPLMVQDLVAHQRAAPRDHSALRLVEYASGPLAVGPLREAIETYGLIFLQIYGMTETGMGTVLQPHHHKIEGAADKDRLASAGQPALHFAIRIVDDQGRDLPIGEMGEILIAGPSMMRGYWNNEAATRQALKGGWMHSGDVGSLDGEGFLTILDRKKDMIVSGGENIYPREVEEALYLHPAVAEAAVIGIPDERWGEAVKAFVVLKPGAEAGERDLVEHCRAHIASYKKPKSISFLAELPRLPNKKIDKKALREPFWKGRSRNVN